MTTQEQQVELEIQSGGNEVPFGYEPPAPNQPTEDPKADSKIKEFELRPSIYNLFVITRLNSAVWDKLALRDKLTLYFYVLVTPFIQIILILMSSRTPSGRMATDWVAPRYSRLKDRVAANSTSRDAPGSEYHIGRNTNYLRTYRPCVNDIWMILLIFASCIYIGNEISQLLFEIKAIKRKYDLSEKQIKDSEYKNNCLCMQCNLVCAPSKRMEFNIIFFVKVVFEFFCFCGGSIAYMLFTLDATQTLYWSDDADQYTRYADAVLDLLAFVFVYEIDDWVFDRVLKTDLTPLSGQWDDDLLKLTVHNEEDQLGPIEKLLFWALVGTLVFVYYIAMGLSDIGDFTIWTSPVVLIFFGAYAAFWTWDSGFFRFPCCKC